MALRGYAICTQARTGSTFLCEVLTSTGVLGRPTEYFNTDGLRIGTPDYPDDPEAQLEQIVTQGATPNGIYGLKIMPHHFDRVAQSNWAARLPSLSFVSLLRLDVLSQAISAVRATQTHQWVPENPAKGEAVYDRAAIAEQLQWFLDERTRWSRYFARNGMPVLHLFYEQVVRGPQATADAVAQLMGLTERPLVDLGKVASVIQGDELNREWRNRFVAESRDLAAF